MGETDSHLKKESWKNRFLWEVPATAARMFGRISLRYVLQLGATIVLLYALGSQARELRGASVSAPQILITEVYFDTPGIDSDEEWIEIANLSAIEVEVSDYRLGDEESQGGGEGMMRFPEGALLEPDAVIIVAQTAAGFRSLYGFNPQYELRDSDATVSGLATDKEWATGDVALANEGDEVLLFDSNGQVVDAVAYGDSAPPPGTFVGPGVSPGFTGQSIERIPAGCDTDSALDWSVRRDPSPGQITLEGACEETVDAAIAALIPIGEIQGSGPMSPRVGTEVAFRGIVTGRLEDQNLRGVRFHTFFVQELPGAEDRDPLTSDGIAVFVGARPPAVVPGDVVTVSGLVTEFYGLTEIDHDGLRVTVESRGNSLPPPILVDPPPDNEAASRYFEPLESMRVTIPTATVAGPTFPGCGFAALSGRESQPRILRHAFEDPVGRLVNVLNTTDVVCDGFPAVAVGDQIDGLVGPLTYHFDLFKIVLQDPSELEIRRVDRPQPMPPTLKDAQFSVATVNMEDLFDGVKDTESDGEPLLTPGQLAAKQKKLSHAIAQTLSCPTILAVQEVEKRELLLDIVANSESQCGFKYLVSHLESPDARGLDLALLTDSRRTSLLGLQLRQSCASLDTAVIDPGIQCPAGERPLFSRPPLEVDLLVDGRPLKIFVNHFKSKREGEFETARWRHAQAAFLAGQVEEILDRDHQANIVVMGDFNDYDRSEVMRIMTQERRLEHVLARLPADEQYSYNFAGAAQLIDWILLSAPLAERVVATTIAHVNADYPYTLTADTGSGISYRASDHDFPIVVLEWAVEESSPAESRAPIPTATPSRPPPEATEPVQAAVNVSEDGSKLESPVLLALGAAALLIAALGLVWRRIRQLP